MDSLKSAAGENFLASYARQRLFQKLEKLDFAVRARREIGGASLGGRNSMAASIPEENGFAQTRARRRSAPYWRPDAANSLIQDQKIFGRQLFQPASCRRNIIHKHDFGTFRFSVRARAAGFSSQGRLIACRCPSTTVPATPNPAAVMRCAAIASRAGMDCVKKAPTNCSKLEKSCVANRFWKMTSRAPPCSSNAARLHFVPPMSPASINLFAYLAALLPHSPRRS